MSDYTNLVRGLREEGRSWREEVGEMPLFDLAADTIDALVKERDELATVIEKAKLAPVQRVPDAVGLSGTVSDVLRETPADVLREHDAALIESLAARAPERRVAVGGGWAALVSSPCAEWLRDCARQVREGEA